MKKDFQIHFPPGVDGNLNLEQFAEKRNCFLSGLFFKLSASKLIIFIVFLPENYDRSNSFFTPYPSSRYIFGLRDHTTYHTTDSFPA